MGSLIIIIPIITAIWCRNLAEKKGLNPVAWGFYGFIFNIFALIVIAYIPDRKINKLP
jgi:hypothetical protein